MDYMNNLNLTKAFRLTTNVYLISLKFNSPKD